ncbi:D-amino acid dehydrogenase small subunit [Rubellimicrobium thermophilum DSM 16684]|uniref:D-amino acid dehydrogenase n=1 Tax=Rubellimicrobium thermophilum DSM 16684 TaxID=1123069 RepID=S9R0J4_9RHOB|nr:D-amino acid dehydrogenase [Rubellimicrobium thermophilum]EPX87126.1 D-amino acid dehydrogenase small subunit [Rubellimicrobium thermophilum DSM 16684]
MKVIVLGAGVIGVTTAWYLRQAGHDVAVLERRAAPGLETSFANAGEVSPGYSAPWAAPGIPLKALRWMLQRHAPLILRPDLDWARLVWLARMLMNCTSAAYATNKARMVRLAEYSRRELEALREATAIRYDERMLGTLQVFRSERQMQAAQKDIAVLQDRGVRFELLDADGCVRAEPGLADARGRIAGGLRLPGDETGDCFKFTTALAALSREAGVSFHHGITVERLLLERGRIVGVITDHGPLQGDAVVVALGSHSPALLRPLGLRLPVCPVKGYSLTIPIRDAARAPVSTVMDETYKVAITRLGDRIRVGGLAEIAGFDLSLPERRKATLLRSLTDLFDGAGAVEDADFWCGLRPMTPDGTPVVGPTPIPGLWTNTGHGTLGWTMAAGSGRVLADLISGIRPEIETADLGLSRYLRRDGIRAGVLRPIEA